jgi:uncharacterized integral membrane protein
VKPKSIVILIVAILFLIILVQNTQTVILSLLFWKIMAPQIVLIPVVLLIGFALGYAVAKLTGRPKKSI